MALTDVRPLDKIVIKEQFLKQRRERNMRTSCSLGERPAGSAVMSNLANVSIGTIFSSSVDRHRAKK
ncbi:hypothetical protein DPMN_108329 [Dreissena polymorpha]|uniref:Uncharacterized protein n=1 Tax=Dreissena polymorpha TaxID=45954 RepID=A0A9D4K8J8_DREPO|nr:hypothetical protein DPMN_108329 [Dreissena polymorpha]